MTDPDQPTDVPATPDDAAASELDPWFYGEKVAARASLSDEELSDDFCLHLWRHAWGEFSVRVLDVEGIEGAEPAPRIVRVRDAPSPGLTTFATLTRSRFVDVDGRTGPNMSGVDVPIRDEYSVIVKREFEAEAISAMRFVLRSLYGGASIPEGTTAGPVFTQEAFGTSFTASHMLVVPNRYGFADQPMRDRVLEMLQLIPITPEEDQYCADHGYSGVIGALNAWLFDASDLRRDPIVRKGADGTWEAMVGD